MNQERNKRKLSAILSADVKGYSRQMGEDQLATLEMLKKENDEFPENQRMEFKIGVNLGDVVNDDGRIYGEGVNIMPPLLGVVID